jgi:hypothetical protein
MVNSPPKDPGNPKDLVAGGKIDPFLVPSAAVLYEALAMEEGRLKYGLVNWRLTGVKMMVYMNALARHAQKLVSGEWADSKTKIPHLASIRACAAIILDADLQGTLIDDRPKAQPGFSELLDEELPVLLAHVREVFKDASPMHITEIENPVAGRAKR